MTRHHALSLLPRLDLRAELDTTWGPARRLGETASWIHLRPPSATWPRARAMGLLLRLSLPCRLPALVVITAACFSYS